MNQETNGLDRRAFLRSAATAAAIGVPKGSPQAAETVVRGALAAEKPAVKRKDTLWLRPFAMDPKSGKVYEDLRSRDGALVFVSPKRSHVLEKSAYATFAEAKPPYLGLDIKDIGMAGPDLLASKVKLQ